MLGKPVSTELHLLVFNSLSSSSSLLWEVCVCGVCGEARGQLQGDSSLLPPFTWVPGTELGLSDLHLYSCASQPSLVFETGSHSVVETGLEFRILHTGYNI